MLERKGFGKMQIEENKLCCGCGACKNICPKSAITMTQNDKGFYVPQIDKLKCIECGMCDNICPVFNYTLKNNNPKSYALLNKDNEKRYNSSSGGAFICFAENIIENNGVVYGAIFDGNTQSVKHKRAVDTETVKLMHGSKYVQSSIDDTYRLAKNDLDDGKKVLFSGTPCQIAGLNNFLRKSYDNLVTIDLVCHGSQSPAVFSKYITEYKEEHKNETLLNINFRSKKNGWGKYLTAVTTTTGIYYIFKDYYPNIMDLSINECCTNCNFARLPRIADVTIGDFWGIDDYKKTLNDGKGTSVVLINSQKGGELFNIIKDKCITEEVPLPAAIIKNPNIKTSTKPHPRCDDFFKEFMEGKTSLKKLSKKYVKTYPCILKMFYKLMPQGIKNLIKNIY